MSSHLPRALMARNWMMLWKLSSCLFAFINLCQLHQVFSALGSGCIELEVNCNVERSTVFTEYQSHIESRDLQALLHADSIKPKKQKAVAVLKIEVCSYEVGSCHQCGDGDRNGCEHETSLEYRRGSRISILQRAFHSKSQRRIMITEDVPFKFCERNSYLRSRPILVHPAKWKTNLLHCIPFQPA